ncbi:MAG: integration host factor subunit beta [Candidatus Coatesbacteria bacterium]|nr:integration host factor subunit beta [Candidatus Coatesbacteria bacterium]
MTKAGIVDKINKTTGFTKKDIAIIIDHFLDFIQDSLVEKGRVDLRKFGNFVIKERKSRIARNPRTNQEVKIPGREVPIFKPSRVFKEKVNNRKK